MEEFVRQRISELLSFHKMNPTQLSKGDSALQVRLSRQLNQGAAISCKTISFILEKFPNVSAEWLMRGNGEMFLKEESKESVVTPRQSESGDVQFMRERIISLESENRVLREMLGLQRDSKQHVDEKIAL